MTEDISYQIGRTPSGHSTDRVHKPSIGSQGSGSASSNLNPRSCVTCRKRKVKCDKKQPCSNCTKARIECVFPSPGRAPRKARKPPDTELLERLRRLEGVVQTLGVQVEEEVNNQDEAQSSESPKEAQSGPPPGPQPAQARLNAQSDPKPQTPEPPPDVGTEVVKQCPKRAMWVEDNSATGLETRFGRLVVDEGRSRYINNSFWASLNAEVEDLKALLVDKPSEDEEDYGSPESQASSNHQGFIFGFSSTNVDMLSLHPSPELIPLYWQIFKENVDPLVKVLHTPTIEPVLFDAATHLDKIPRGFETLMFAIYYGVVTSMMSNECVAVLGEERSVLIKRYRFAFEQALARANFLVTDEIVVLQSFVLFLILLRRNDDARVIWTLTGLVVRIAQTLGMHRDGAHFALSPFDIEMRRRLWWSVCILDLRASEDHGCDPTVNDAAFDTKMPLNINDADISPDSKDFPEPRLGCTEMTFCLVRFEVASIFRRLQYVPPGKPGKCSQFYAAASLENKERWIRESHQRLEERYLQHCDMSVPLYWVIATVTRLIMSKMWLMVYHPYQRIDGGASLPQETRDKLFITSLENVEYSILLETEARTMKWGWLFRTYVQWHAIAFLLSELCVRTKGEAVKRAWRAVECTAARRWGDPINEAKKGCLWKPLRRLMAKARAAREKALEEERSGSATNRLLPGGDVLSEFGFGDILDPAQQDFETFMAGATEPPRVATKQPQTPSSNEPLRNYSSNLPPLSQLRQQQPSSTQEAQQKQQLVDFSLKSATTNPTFPTEQPILNPTPESQVSPQSNGLSNGLQSTAPNDLQTGNMDWLANPTFGLEMSPTFGNVDEPVNWENWDDMVREYSMEVDPKPGDQGHFGGSMGGITQWF